MNDDGTMSPYPTSTGDTPVQLYQIPAGRVINYGGANYITNSVGTMSPY